MERPRMDKVSAAFFVELLSEMDLHDWEVVVYGDNIISYTGDAICIKKTTEEKEFKLVNPDCLERAKEFLHEDVEIYTFNFDLDWNKAIGADKLREIMSLKIDWKAKRELIMDAWKPYNIGSHNDTDFYLDNEPGTWFEFEEAWEDQ